MKKNHDLSLDGPASPLSFRASNQSARYSAQPSDIFLLAGSRNGRRLADDLILFFPHRAAQGRHYYLAGPAFPAFAAVESSRRPFFFIPFSTQ